MKNKKIPVLCLAILWGALSLGLWFGPRQAVSQAERRPLAQFPALTGKNLLSGSFMEKFEDFTLDQFPLRDEFRSLKAVVHSYGLGQKDTNGIYIALDHAAKQEYPLNRDSLDHAIDRLSYLYNKYLTDSRVVMAIVPDKGYYLAEQSGHLAMDYEALFATFRQGLPWAEQVDLTDALTLDSYYRTDTHWRQEMLLPAAKLLCDALQVSAPRQEDYTRTVLDQPFHGVYYGQAALPMEPDTICLLESPLLSGCRVYNHETGREGSVYDLSRLEGEDKYEVFLSGPRSLLTIENPAAETRRELIVFRDSFGSAMVPLLVNDYAKVTLVDIRYIQIDLLEKYLDFRGQDVLLLYSTLVLNNSETIK